MPPATGRDAAPSAWREDTPPEHIGPFRIVGVLGRGGMGVVFDALAPSGERVALKVIRPHAIDHEQAHILVARFHREAKILREMNHPGVVRLVDAGEVDGTLYLAMERIEGVSLLTIRRRGPLGYDALVQLGIQLADALQHLHEAGVIHRDIKPANILINARGQPVITDFGISGMSEATGITRMGDLLGSPGFMAPEVTEGAPPTELSDQFALGRLLYELGAVGPAKKLPKNAPILQILTESLEIDWNRFPKADRWPSLEQVLRRMVATEPLERYPNATAVRAALLALTTADLLDLDTLSEHVGRLGVKPRGPWDEVSEISEAGQDATEIPPRPAAPPPPVLSPAVPEISVRKITSSEPRARADAGDTEASPPAFAFPGVEPALALPAAEAMIPAQPAPPARLRLPVPAHESEAPTMPPPGPRRPWEHLPASPEVASVSLSAKLAALEVRGPNDTIPEPIPASVLGAALQRVEVAAVEPATPAGDPRGLGSALEAMRETALLPRDGSRAAPPFREVLRETVSTLEAAPDATAEQLVRLEKQNARLRAELAVLARQGRAAQGSPLGLPLVAALVVLAGIVGAAAGWLLHHPAPPPPPVVLVAPGTGDLADPVARYKSAGNPSSVDVDAALGFYLAALEHLARQDLAGAEANLRQCVETADLPDCHRTLGTLLALQRRPASRTHFDHYLHIAPSAPDADAIRRLLQNP